MPDPSSLIETLRGTSLMLIALRKTIADSGHKDAMLDIDAFLSIAMVETERSLARAEKRRVAEPRRYSGISDRPAHPRVSIGMHGHGADRSWRAGGKVARAPFYLTRRR